MFFAGSQRGIPVATRGSRADTPWHSSSSKLANMMSWSSCVSHRQSVSRLANVFDSATAAKTSCCFRYAYQEPERAVANVHDQPNNGASGRACKAA